MGTWGIGPFDNDEASDWLYDLEKSTDSSVIAKALSAVTETGNDYLEATYCWNAIAAAEIVAAVRGHTIGKIPENAVSWIEKNRSLNVANLVSPALAALNRIQTNSELKELWDESDEAPLWYAAIEDLTKRLKI